MTVRTGKPNEMLLRPMLNFAPGASARSARDRIQCHQGAVLTCGDRDGQRIEIDLLIRQAGIPGTFQDVARHCQPARDVLRYAVVVEEQGDHAGSVAWDEGQHTIQTPLLSTDRVDQRRPDDAGQGCGQGRSVGAVETQRRFGHSLHRLHEPAQVIGLALRRRAGVDIDVTGTGGHLPLRQILHEGHVTRCDGLQPSSSTSR